MPSLDTANFQDFFKSEAFLHWILTGVAFFASLSVAIFIRHLLTRYLRKRHGTANWIAYVEPIIQSSHYPFFLAFAIYISLLVSPVPFEIKSWFNRLFAVAIIFQMGIWASAILELGLDRLAKKTLPTDQERGTLYRAGRMVAKILLWAAVFLLILDNFGINITTFIAGLGIGGIAVALAVQKILGDVFASISILMDKPFVIGDIVGVGEFRGVVEDIGIKTTKVRASTGERVIFSNSDLLESRIRNFSQMWERRVEFSVGVEYETDIKKLRQIPEIVKSILSTLPDTRFERAQLTVLGAYSLDFQVSYFVTKPQFEIAAEILHLFNLRLIEEFQKQGIGFAYPTQKLLTAQGLAVPPRPTN